METMSTRRAMVCTQTATRMETSWMMPTLLTP
ncbi:unnamed protein product [Chondrus crispus]|uniref:Uncharacterized protein n=1 Tax=Chondrus crispus TaxID=2769 RepID=S0F393_CHOCR|nr:unnamed protein product [Chondrus crispus]CDF77577.1 unnamed protein product [Chondrus crispus]|eukprot:XP_005718078.1 unnamed protein product [Chondrus crispus]